MKNTQPDGRMMGVCLCAWGVLAARLCTALHTHIHIGVYTHALGVRGHIQRCVRMCGKRVPRHLVLWVRTCVRPCTHTHTQMARRGLCNRLADSPTYLTRTAHPSTHPSIHPVVRLIHTHVRVRTHIMHTHTANEDVTNRYMPTYMATDCLSPSLSHRRSWTA
mmetsp:Transcript_8171/g.23217  ORF Transcript_8171/g.23217 Transcript_8171/m.23217 type:complete len:163 (-) Transcript_8171:93-581(-)